VEICNWVPCLLAVLALFVLTTIAADAANPAVQQWSFDRSTFDPSVAPGSDFNQNVYGARCKPANIPADLPFASWPRCFATKAKDDDRKKLLLGTPKINDSEYFGTCTHSHPFEAWT
jgi:hypothetical protein